LKGEVLSKRLFRAGSMIFEGGDVGDCAYVIDRGRVEVATNYNGEKTVLGIMGPGEILGDMAIIDDEPRSASAIAIDDTVLTVITPEQVTTRLQEADPVLRLLLMVTLERYRNELRRFQGGNDEQPAAQDRQGKRRALLTQDIIASSQQTAIDKFKLESDLRGAIANDQFHLYYQPIISLDGGAVAGFEALIRWIHPERGFVNPGDFIAVAEETALMVPIGRWVLQQACEDLKTFNELALESGSPPIFVSVNVSGRQFASGNFLGDLRESLADTGVDPKNVKLEITESLLMNYTHALDWIREAREQGVRIALDDFGTGYSSLSYLLHFPIDTLKVDRAFVQHMHEDTRSASLVAAIVNMAHTLSFDVVAEGIEEAEQSVALADMGCEYAQGYRYARPLPIADAREFLRNAGAS
jgi:EAL domain-containing protein (putative c-di-GMP-specific phosphodiesterase class I)/CRP-like cAMP-binding protein